MERFLQGPPLGATIPQTPTRLSDLVGGVYGPGASVASTGMSALRPAIKAGVAQAVGETWEDVLEYYLVSLNYILTHSLNPIICVSSTRTAARLTLPIASVKSSTKGVSIHPRAVLPQARKESVASLEISIEHATTSSKSPAKSGLATLKTPSNTRPSPPRKKVPAALVEWATQPPPLHTSVVCICVGRVLELILLWRGCGLRGGTKGVIGSVLMRLGLFGEMDWLGGGLMRRRRLRILVLLLGRSWRKLRLILANTIIVSCPHLFDLIFLMVCYRAW